MAVKDSVAYQYAKWCLEDGNFYVGKYVRLQAAAWARIVDGADEESMKGCMRRCRKYWG